MVASCAVDAAGGTRQLGVDRHEDGAVLSGHDRRQHEFDAVFQYRHDPVAGDDAQSRQVARQCVTVPVERGEGRPRAMFERHELSLAMCLCLPPHEIEQGPVCRINRHGCTISLSLALPDVDRATIFLRTAGSRADRTRSNAADGRCETLRLRCLRVGQSSVQVHPAFAFEPLACRSSHRS